MEHYETRGTIQNPKGAAQVISFEGFMLEGRTGRLNVTPTDIDGYVHFDNYNGFVFFELKHHGGMPDGQKNGLTAAADTLNAGGGNSVLFLATHQTPAEHPVIAKDATVTAIYTGGAWREPDKEQTLYEWVNMFLNHWKKRAGA